MEHVFATVVSFLDELGYQRISLKSDKEPSVVARAHEISRRRQADNGLTTILEEIPILPGLSAHCLACTPRCFRS